jgi:hypothetical protein
MQRVTVLGDEPRGGEPRWGHDDELPLSASTALFRAR